MNKKAAGVLFSGAPPSYTETVWRTTLNFMVENLDVGLSLYRPNPVGTAIRCVLCGQTQPKGGLKRPRQNGEKLDFYACIDRKKCEERTNKNG